MHIITRYNEKLTNYTKIGKVSLKMPHSKSYPVSQLNGKPMDNSKTSEKPKETLACSYGLCLGLIAGTVSLVFVVFVYGMPNSFFPKQKELLKNLKHVPQQGNLVMYPPFLDADNDIGANDSYHIILSSQSVKKTTQNILQLLQAYPKDWTQNYTQCWVQHSEYDKPCFFDVSWLGESCSQKDFGYTEEKGIFSPCVFFRLEMTDTWKPVSYIKTDLPQSMRDHYDPSFIPVFCRPKLPEEAVKLKKITNVPEKGFSVAYFPISNFSSELYLSPIVATQFHGIKKGTNITVECSILALNSLLLHNEGKIKITFSSPS